MIDEPIRFSPKIKLEQKPRNVFSPSRLISVGGFLFGITAFILGCIYWYATALNQTPKDFPIDKAVTIERGTSVKDISEILQAEGIVKSSALLYYALIFLHEPTDVKASTYVFDEPLTTTGIAELLTKGDFDTDLIRFTHIEGERATQVAKRAAAILPNFNYDAFLVSAEPFEGKLFPETYFIPADFTEAKLLTLMTDTFAQKTEFLTDKINENSLTLDEIIILASIIEREANTLESKKLVSGILLNRLESNMPLQADASIEYVLDKPLSELTAEDLKVDSPYNTYINSGLPPTPIGNPGLEAIEAVLDPTESDYIFYITDNDGEFHYSKNYNEHLKNIEKYLR